MFFFVCIRDDINILWNYIETLLSQLNIEPHDEAIIAIAYDTRFVR